MLRVPDHVDLTSVTLLTQDQTGGLEVWDENTGSWLCLPVFDDCILLNAGVFLQHWTGGIVQAVLPGVAAALTCCVTYKATRHRVVAFRRLHQPPLLAQRPSRPLTAQWTFDPRPQTTTPLIA